MKKTVISVLLLLSLLCTLFAQEKPDALALYRTGRNLESAGRIEDAKASFQKAANVCRQELQAKPNNIESYVVLTWSLLRMEKFPETITECNKALKINPKEYRIIETLGEAHFYNKNYEGCINYFEQYVNAMPNGERCSTAYFFLGEAYRILHKYEHADISYSAALRKDPTMPLWWYRLGQAREKSGNTEKAKVAYQQALKYRPNYPDASAALQRL